MSVELRPLTTRNLRSVLAIEADRFEEPWSRATLASELAVRADRRYLGAFEGRTLLGYVGLMVAADEGAITNIALRADAEGRGVGSALLAAGLDLAASLGVVTLSLEVKVGNDRAQALYRRMGFAPVGVRRGYYGQGRDALVMRLDDLGSAAEAARRRALAGRPS